MVSGAAIGFPAAVFALAGLLAIVLLGVNRLHAWRDARIARLERQAAFMLTAWADGRGAPAGLVPWAHLGRADRLVMLACWARTLPLLEPRRSAAARAGLRRDGMLDPVMSGLRGRSTLRRAEACRLLGRLGGSDAVAPLVERLGDQNPAVRREAIGALADLGAVEALVDIARAIDTTNDWGNLLTTMRLVRLGPRAVPTIGALLASATSAETLKALLQVSGGLGAAADPGQVRLLALHRNPEVRVEALRTLGCIAPEAESVTVCLAAMDDQEWPVRALAAASLGRLGDPAAVPRLERAMGDPAYWVRHHVTGALLALGSAGAAALTRARKHQNPFVRDMAAQALWQGSRGRAA
jgi:HEAT repeat protein